MKNTLLGIALLAATCGAQTAQAADDESGLIFGAGLGQSHVEADEANIDGSSNGWKGFVGWRFNQYVSVEGAFIDTDSIEHNYTDRLVGSADGEIMQLAVIGTLPVNEWFSVYGRAGPNWYDAASELKFDGETIDTGEESGTEFGWGAGISALWDNALFRLEYEATDVGSIADFSLVSLSIAWRL